MSNPNDAATLPVTPEVPSTPASPQAPEIKVDTDADYAAIMANIRSAGIPAAPAAPPEEPSEPIPTEPTPSPTEPVPAGEPAVETVPVTPEPPTEPEVIDPISEPVTQPNAGYKPPQFRFRPQDEVEEKAMWIRRGNPDIPLKQAISMAERELGIQPETPPTAATTPVQTEVLPDINGIANEILTLEEQHKVAIQLQDGDQMAETWGQIRAKERELAAAQQQAAQAQAVRRQQEDATWERSNQEAATLYPEFADTNSDFHKRCVEIDQAFKQTNDPRYGRHDKPKLLAQIVAAEMNRVPQVPGSRPKAAPVTPAKATPQAPTPPRPASPPLPVAPIAGGISSPSTALAPLEQVLQGISREDQYLDLMAMIRGQRLA